MNTSVVQAAHTNTSSLYNASIVTLELVRDSRHCCVSPKWSVYVNRTVSLTQTNEQTNRISLHREMCYRCEKRL